MKPGPLELFTSQELINELLRRTTFLGVIVCSEQEFRNEEWAGERVFKVHFNANLDAEQAGRLLSTVSGHLDRNNS